MSTSYTQIRLTEVKDSAPELGLGEVQEARFAKDDLEAEDSGMSAPGTTATAS